MVETISSGEGVMHIPPLTQREQKWLKELETQSKRIEILQDTLECIEDLVARKRDWDPTDNAILELCIVRDPE